MTPKARNTGAGVTDTEGLGELRQPNSIMKNFLRLTAVICALFVACQSWAGTKVEGNTAVATPEKTEEAVPLIFSRLIPVTSLKAI